MKRIVIAEGAFAFDPDLCCPLLSKPGELPDVIPAFKKISGKNGRIVFEEFEEVGLDE